MDFATLTLVSLFLISASLYAFAWLVSVAEWQIHLAAIDTASAREDRRDNARARAYQARLAMAPTVVGAPVAREARASASTRLTVRPLATPAIVASTRARTPTLRLPRKLSRRARVAIARDRLRDWQGKAIGHVTLTLTCAHAIRSEMIYCHGRELARLRELKSARLDSLARAA